MEAWGWENRKPKESQQSPKEVLKNAWEVPKTENSLDSLRGDIELTTITKSLRTKIMALNTGFNPDAFIQGIEKQIREKLISQEKIPTWAKQLFYSDLKGLVARFEDTMSERKLGLNQKQNTIETVWNATGKENSPAGRLEFVLRGTFEKYITGATEGLYTAFVEQKIIGNAIYHETTWNLFAKNIIDTDAKYPGLNIASYIDSRAQKDYIGDKFLSRDIGMDILKKLWWKLSPEAFNSITGNLSRNSLTEAIRLRSSGKVPWSPGYPAQLYLSPDTIVTIGGKKMDIVDIISEYSAVSKEFILKQSEIGDARDRAIGESVIWKIRKTAGLSELKNEFDFLDTAEVKTDMTLAGLIRIATQMSSIFVPWPWGASDLTSALTAIDNGTGEMLPWYERSIYALFGVLDITVAGSALASIRKWMRMVKLIKMIQRISGKIPAMIEKHLADGGKISKDMADILVRFGKSLGEEAGRKIEEMMRKQGLILGFTEEPKIRHGAIAKPMQSPRALRTIESVFSDKKFQEYYAQFSDEHLTEMYRNNDPLLWEMLLQKRALEDIRTLEERGYGLKAREDFDAFILSPKNAINAWLAKRWVSRESQIEKIVFDFKRKSSSDVDNLYGMIKLSDWWEKNNWLKSIIVAFFDRTTRIEWHLIDAIILDNGQMTLKYGGKEKKFQSPTELAAFIDWFPQKYSIKNSEMLKRVNSIKVVWSFIGKEYYATLAKIPERLWGMLEKKWVNILFTDAPLTNTIGESWVHSPPRWWEWASDWSKTWGAYNPANKQVIVSMIERCRGEHVILHEYGHAVWEVMGLDNHPELIKAQVRLFDRLQPYFQQWWPGGKAGVNEFVAETFSDFMRLPQNEFIKNYDRELYNFYTMKMQEFERIPSKWENILMVWKEWFMTFFDMAWFKLQQFIQNYPNTSLWVSTWPLLWMAGYIGYKEVTQDWQTEVIEKGK